MLPVLCMAAFCAFAQVFHSTTTVVGLAVLAYLVPYGAITLVSLAGPRRATPSDLLGR